MKNFSVLFMVMVLGLCLMVSNFANAAAINLKEGQIVIDLNKLHGDDAAAVLKAYQATQEIQVPKVEVIKKDAEDWANIGTNISKAISSACKELSIGVNEFIQTPAGKLTTFLIVWKIIGREILNFFVGTLAWIALTSIILWSYRRVHLAERVVDEKGHVSYEPRYVFSNDTAKAWSAVGHAGLFVIFTLFCLRIALP